MDTSGQKVDKHFIIINNTIHSVYISPENIHERLIGIKSVFPVNNIRNAVLNGMNPITVLYG